MKGYVISEVEVLDEAQAADYRRLAEESIREYDGRYIVRGATPEIVEGDPAGQRRIVIVEFASLERAREWYASEAYARALAIRRSALDRRMAFVEGVAP